MLILFGTAFIKSQLSADKTSITPEDNEVSDSEPEKDKINNNSDSTEVANDESAIESIAEPEDVSEHDSIAKSDQVLTTLQNRKGVRKRF